MNEIDVKYEKNSSDSVCIKFKCHIRNNFEKNIHYSDTMYILLKYCLAYKLRSIYGSVYSFDVLGFKLDDSVYEIEVTTSKNKAILVIQGILKELYNIRYTEGYVNEHHVNIIRNNLKTSILKSMEESLLFSDSTSTEFDEDMINNYNTVDTLINLEYVKGMIEQIINSEHIEIIYKTKEQFTKNDSDKYENETVKKYVRQ